MRRVNIGQPPRTANMLSQEMQWVALALVEIERASSENDQRVIASAFTVTNVTPTRTLDGSTATLPDLINFIGTFILDLREGGVKKG